MPDFICRKITGNIGEMNKNPKKQSTLETWLRNGQHSVDERESPRVPDWFLNSNIRELVRKNIKKHYPTNYWRNQSLTNKLIEKFFNNYQKHPTSRRSPILRLNRLILMPSLETPDMNPICFMNQILMECFVDMSKKNYYLMCELKAYELIMRQEERVRDGSVFPTFESLTAKTIQVYQRNHVGNNQPPMRRLENVSRMSEVAASGHEKETQQNPPRRKKSTAAPLSVLKKRRTAEIEKEREESMDEGLRNFFDENYKLPPEVLKKARKELRKIDKAEKAAASKSRRRIREIPPDSESEEVVICDESPGQTSMDRSPPMKKKRRIVDTPVFESPGRKSTESEHQFKNPELEMSPSYRKMKNLTEARTSTPARSPGLHLLAAAVSPKAPSKNIRRRVSFESPGKQVDVSQELVVPVPKRSKTFRNPDQEKSTNRNATQNASTTGNSPADSLGVKPQMMEDERKTETSCDPEETPAWLRDFFDENVAYERQLISNNCNEDVIMSETENLSEEPIGAVISTTENRVTSTPLDQETSEIDCEAPAWLRDFFDENVAYERQLISNSCDEDVIMCETESLSEEPIGAIVSTPAVCPDDWIGELPDDSEVALRGHSAIEERLIGGINEEVIDFPCDRMAENTSVETEEKSYDQETLENPPTVHETQTEEDLHVTQDLFQTQVSSNESCKTVEEDEVSLSTDSYQSVENLRNESEFCADVVVDKLAAEEIAKDLEISTDKMSENEIEEVALPLLTCLYHQLTDDDVVFVGKIYPATPELIYVEDLTQSISLTQISQDPLILEMSEIFGH